MGCLLRHCGHGVRHNQPSPHGARPRPTRRHRPRQRDLPLRQQRHPRREQRHRFPAATAGMAIVPSLWSPHRRRRPNNCPALKRSWRLGEVHRGPRHPRLHPLHSLEPPTELCPRERSRAEALWSLDPFCCTDADPHDTHHRHKAVLRAACARLWSSPCDRARAAAGLRTKQVSAQPPS